VFSQIPTIPAPVKGPVGSIIVSSDIARILENKDEISFDLGRQIYKFDAGIRVIEDPLLEQGTVYTVYENHLPNLLFKRQTVDTCFEIKLKKTPLEEFVEGVFKEEIDSGECKPVREPTRITIPVNGPKMTYEDACKPMM